MTDRPADKEEERYAEQRARLLRQVQREMGLTRGYTGLGSLSEPVARALGRVPRHRFVPERYRDQAYINEPLPIGHGQTISQPYIVALMTELLRPEAEHKVLEIGTGCGYQTAMLAELAGEVYSIEVVPPLGEAAAERLRELGYDNIRTRVGDGYHGWPEHAPYDGIIVTAAVPEIPPPLIEQLKNGGRLVLPVGRPYSGQSLILVSKDARGKVSERAVLPVAFVPLTRGA